MKITVPTLKLILTTHQVRIVTSFFVSVYTAALEPMMMSMDDVIAIARGPPLGV